MVFYTIIRLGEGNITGRSGRERGPAAFLEGITLLKRFS
jgi:hypothetical protein